MLRAEPHKGTRWEGKSTEEAGPVGCWGEREDGTLYILSIYTALLLAWVDIVLAQPQVQTLLWNFLEFTLSKFLFFPISIANI